MAEPRLPEHPLPNNRALYWFSEDLRLKDNLVLSDLISRHQSIAFIYLLDPAWLIPNNFQHCLLGAHRLRFIVHSLLDLEQQLARLGHTLHICQGDPVKLIPQWVTRHGINQVACANHVGCYESNTLHVLNRLLPQQFIASEWNNSLFGQNLLEAYPLFENSLQFESFSKFRNTLEKGRAEVTLPCQTWMGDLPAPFNLHGEFISAMQLQELLGLATPSKNEVAVANQEVFLAGEQAALAHLNDYFSSAAPSTYKQTRNQLDGWQSSTKLSPYLANGNLSPRQIWAAVNKYEREHIKNESTYWIKFELLWREYFHCLAVRQGASLYAFKGLSQHKPLSAFYPERFAKWCNGNTPYPLVNACIKQLMQTGFISNRGRQIVASCLVHDLGIDWRYGAAYFQQQLIDHDLASNWGNWQYIAGVGVDPRGGRHFNITKQTACYDPHGEFIAKWQGAVTSQSLDSVDAADWPNMAD
ncbi:DASH family cryptochrome [Agarivorans sp. MS3-6]